MLDIKSVKKGDTLVWMDERIQVVERLGDVIVFVRPVFEGGSVGPIRGPQDINDLATYGWKKEEQ